MKIRLALLIACVAVPASAQWGDTGPTLVFFDWGKGELSNDAKATLDRLAERYAASPRAITIDGHSDKSGASAGNLSSSRKRADTVSDYLVGKGVPASAMTVRAYGETWPLIPTEDGVREIQNRRVEIRWAPAG